MSWTGAIVLYACSWFLALFLLLPRGQATQEEAGSVEPGTPVGAPAEIRIKRKFLWATLLGTLPVIATALVMEFEVLMLDDFEFLFPDSFLEEPLSTR